MVAKSGTEIKSAADVQHGTSAKIALPTRRTRGVERPTTLPRTNRPDDECDFPSFSSDVLSHNAAPLEDKRETQSALDSSSSAKHPDVKSPYNRDEPSGERCLPAGPLSTGGSTEVPEMTRRSGDAHTKSRNYANMTTGIAVDLTRDLNILGLSDKIPHVGRNKLPTVGRVTGMAPLEGEVDWKNTESSNGGIYMDLTHESLDKDDYGDSILPSDQSNPPTAASDHPNNNSGHAVTTIHSQITSSLKSFVIPKDGFGGHAHSPPVLPRVEDRISASPLHPIASGSEKRKREEDGHGEERCGRKEGSKPRKRAGNVPQFPRMSALIQETKLADVQPLPSLGQRPKPKMKGKMSGK